MQFDVLAQRVGRHPGVNRDLAAATLAGEDLQSDSPHDVSGEQLLSTVRATGAAWSMNIKLISSSIKEVP